MTLDLSTDAVTNILLIVVSAALVVYLVVALLDPERF
ncbi:K(+)-transporting ATPase subunit F [Mycobacterium sp. NPDC050853]|nr:K(+)-transporting ATPase subunit F [Mycobacteroides sp. LB1]